MIDRERRSVLWGLSALGACAAGGCAPKAAHGTRVNVLSSQGTLTLTMQRLEEDRAYCRDLGLDLDVIPVASGTNIIGPLLNGQADICIFAGFSQLLAAIEKGADLRVLAGASIKGQQALFSHDPAVRRVRDLAGKSVGVGAVGAQLYQVVTALLRKKGVDPSTVQFVNIGSSGDVFRAVAAGRVAAGNGEADVLADMDRLGVHMLEDGDYATELPEYTWQASFSSRAAIRDKRDALVRTLAGYRKLFRFAQNPGSKTAYLKAQVAAMGARDTDAAMRSAISQWNYLQRHRTYAEDLAISPERLHYMQLLNVELGIQKRILPYAAVIDDSLAKEAIARFP